MLALTAGIDVELPDTHRLRAGTGGPGRAAASCPKSSSTGPSGGCSRQKIELGLLDPDWTPEASVVDAAAPTSTRPPTGRWRREMAERSDHPARRRDRAAAARRRPPGAARGWPWSGRARTTRGRSWAATPSPTTCCPAIPGVGLGIDVPSAVDALRAELPDVEVGYAAGLRRARRGPLRVPRRRRGGRRRRPVRRVRRATSPACSASARPARAATPRTCGCPGVQADLLAALLDDRHAGRRGRRLRAALRPRRRPRPEQPGLVQAFMPGEEGGAAIAGVLSGRVQPVRQAAGADPAAPGRAAQHLPAAAAGRPGERGHQQPGPDTAVPVRLRRARTPSFASTTCGSSDDRDRHRRRAHGDGAGPQHRRARGRRGGPAVPARRAGPGRPAGEAAHRLRPGEPGCR